MASRNQGWCDRDGSGFSETDFIQNLGMPTITFIVIVFAQVCDSRLPPQL